MVPRCTINWGYRIYFIKSMFCVESSASFEALLWETGCPAVLGVWEVTPVFVSQHLVGKRKGPSACAPCEPSGSAAGSVGRERHGQLTPKLLPTAQQGRPAS